MDTIDLSDPLINDFQEEARESLDALDQGFLALETNIEHPESEVINQIFREVHTIKGTAGFFGLTNIQTLAHAMENVFDDVRNGKYKISTESMNTLFDGLDKLKVMVNDLANSQTMEISELVSTLNKIAENSKTKNASEDIQNNDIDETISWEIAISQLENDGISFDIEEMTARLLTEDRHHNVEKALSGFMFNEFFRNNSCRQHIEGNKRTARHPVSHHQ